MNPDRTKTIRRRVRLLTWLFIAGLVLSGATAIPLESEVNGLVRFTGAGRMAGGAGSMEAPAWVDSQFGSPACDGNVLAPLTLHPVQPPGKVNRRPGDEIG